MKQRHTAAIWEKNITGLQEPAKPIMMEPQIFGQKERILVVEDTPINYEVVESFLSQANLVCEHAPSGFSALDLCRKRGRRYYQLILMDIHMPKMDGYETSRKIKEMGVTAPIIALTATTMNKSILKKYRDLFEDYILKPFCCALLYKKIQPYLLTPCIFAEPAGTIAAFAPEDPYAGRFRAIENLGGSTAFYEKHLAKFKKSYADSADKLEACLASGDTESARIIAHSIKGLAGTLGLTPLAKSAARLETALNDGLTELDDLLFSFRKNLSQVISS